ncbi:hypothetical protein XfCFBP8356_004960 [Xylella fastidiosa subsp. sandyi]
MVNVPVKQMHDTLSAIEHRLPDIYTFHDLQLLCGRGKKVKRARVEEWARRQGIPYKYDGEGGIWTTLQALNAALGIGTDLDDVPYRPEDLV